MNRSFSAVRGALALLVMFAALGPSAWALGTPYLFPDFDETTESSVAFWWGLSDQDGLHHFEVWANINEAGFEQVGLDIDDPDPNHWIGTIGGLGIEDTCQVKVYACTLNDTIMNPSNVYDLWVLPAPPTIDDVVLNNDYTVDISWSTSDPSGFDGWFELYRCDNATDEYGNGDYTSIRVAGTTEFSADDYFYMFDMSEENKWYWYEIRAYNLLYQESVGSRMQVKVNLFAPTSVSATKYTNPDRIVVSWYDNSMLNTQYEVIRYDEYGQNPLTVATPGDTQGSQGAMSINDTPSPGTWFYRVRAKYPDPNPPYSTIYSLTSVWKQVIF
jgi:hypothetical protein